MPTTSEFGHEDREGSLGEGICFPHHCAPAPLSPALLHKTPVASNPLNADSRPQVHPMPWRNQAGAGSLADGQRLTMSAAPAGA
ncbi:hypothetical protein ACQE2J_03035 [Brevibacterium sp. LE-L]|uniref:hypothetical protein n=1 Tax=unclassified Brevibacterium TaxID=2614124 RepID=UPI003CF1D039